MIGVGTNGNDYSNGHSALDNLSPTEQTRQIAIQELIRTEESYMEDLSIVIEVISDFIHLKV